MDEMDAIGARRGGGTLRLGVALSSLISVACIAVACGPMPGTTQPEWAPSGSSTAGPGPGESWLFRACTASASIDPAKRALGAMVLALNEKEWTIDQLDVANDIVVGSVCLWNNPRHCAQARFLCGKNGDVFVEPTYVQYNMHDDLQRWINVLEQSFSKFRCYTDPAMREGVNKYGILY
jgi:hypothetical protein